MNLARFPQLHHQKVWPALLVCFAGLAVRADPTADPAKLAVANTGFAFDLLQQIVKEQPDANVFISPFSVSTVLQMVGNGAAGETRTEMQSVLKTTGLPAGPLNEECRNLNQSLTSLPDVTLNLANGIWYQKKFQLKPAFVAENKNYFLAELAGVDFSKSKSADIINGWAEKQTRGKIKDVVQFPFPPLTRVILANAIYFKGKWVKPFEKNQTRPQAFYRPGGEKQVPLMRQRGHFSYQEGDGFQAVELPYAGGRLRICVFLPATNSNPAKLLADLNSDTWRDKILPRFTDHEGTLALPRFKIEYKIVLNEPLKALGMHQAFDSRADFSAMADTREVLYVSEVWQKSFVDVNEEGTEAAAVTGVRMTTLAAMRPLQPFEMIVDRPFLFVIGDEQTQSILFMGVVYDPST
jgi:serpin B